LQCTFLHSTPQTNQINKTKPKICANTGAIPDNTRNQEQELDPKQETSPQPTKIDNKNQFSKFLPTAQHKAYIEKPRKQQKTP
jgi:hypothetical protein